eukprot:gene28100-36992_t
MPLVRATITIQDPSCELKNVREALSFIYRTRGIDGLWHGVSADRAEVCDRGGCERLLGGCAAPWRSPR